jgi:hypothetical protein
VKLASGLAMRPYGVDGLYERVTMKDYGMRAVRVLLLGTALGVVPALAVAQTVPVDIENLTALAASPEAAQVLALPASDLAGLLTTASPEQLTTFVAALTPAELDALVALLVVNRAEPQLMAAIVSAALLLDSARAALLIDIIQGDAPPAARSQIAAGLFGRIDSCRPDLERAAHGAHVLAALSLDTGLAPRLIAVGNGCNEADAQRLAEILFAILETADETLASAIETALALEGGQMLRLIAALRGELEVAAVTPEPPAPLVPPTPIGAGAASGGASATTAGVDAIFAQAGSGGGIGIGAGPVFSPVRAATTVSPVQ